MFLIRPKISRDVSAVLADSLDKTVTFISMAFYDNWNGKRNHNEFLIK